jgi:hypothetical protein
MRGKKGGKKSGEIRRENKRFSEVLKGQISVVLDSEGNTSVDAINKELIRRVRSKKTTDKDFAALYTLVVSMTGEKPADVLNLTADEGVKGIEISFVDKSKRSGEAERDPQIASEYTAPIGIKDE